MNIVKGIACLVAGHNTKGSESIVNTFCANNWLKRCKRCGLYVMHGDIGSITLSKEGALKIKTEFEEEMQRLDKILAERGRNGK